MTKFTLILISALAASSALAGAPPGVHITATTSPAPQGAPPGVHITAVPRPAAMHIVIAPPVKG